MSCFANTSVLRGTRTILSSGPQLAAYPAWRNLLDASATVLILGLVASLALYIFSRFLKGVREELADKRRMMAETVL